MDAKTFGIFLAHIRKEKKMTQAQLAAKLNVTDKAVSRWERGLGFPDITTMEPLADALDISVLELMRAEKRTDAAAKEQYSREEVSEMLQSAAQISRMQGMQEKQANVVAAVLFFVVAVLAYQSNHANIGGALFVGGIAAGVGVSGFYLWKNWEDAAGRRIYGSLFAGLGIFFLGLCQLLFPAEWRQEHGRLIATVICYGGLVVLVGASYRCAVDFMRRKKPVSLIFAVLGMIAAFVVLWNFGGQMAKKF